MQTGAESSVRDPLDRLAPEVCAELAADARARFWKLDEADPVEAGVLRLVVRRLARHLLA